MKKIISFLLFIAVSFCATAQWQGKKIKVAQLQSVHDLSVARTNPQVAWAICNRLIVSTDDISPFIEAKYLNIMRTNDGGTTWVPLTSPLGVTMVATSICALSESVAWISYASTNPSGGYHNFVSKTTDGGKTWTKYLQNGFPIVGYVDLVYFWDEKNGVAIGDPTDSYFEVWTTIDGGQNWTRQPSSTALVAKTVEEVGSSGGHGSYDVRGNTIWFLTVVPNSNSIYKGNRLLRSKDMGNLPFC